VGKGGPQGRTKYLSIADNVIEENAKTPPELNDRAKFCEARLPRWVILVSALGLEPRTY
jgi:hypothetical protein